MYGMKRMLYKYGVIIMIIKLKINNLPNMKNNSQNR